MSVIARCRGWDERDYNLWSDIQSLPSYGLIGTDSDHMISCKAVVDLMERHAEERVKSKTCKVCGLPKSFDIHYKGNADFHPFEREV